MLRENLTNLVFSSTVLRATRRGWQKTGNTVVEETASKLKLSSSTWAALALMTPWIPIFPEF